MIQLIIVLAVLGLIAWLVTTYIPMPPAMRTVIIAVVCLVAIIYAIRALGITI